MHNIADLATDYTSQVSPVDWVDLILRTQDLTYDRKTFKGNYD